MNAPPGLWTRVGLALLCLCLGAVVALIGQAIVPGDAWWLALPVALAIGWLWVADPTRCEPPR